MAKKQESISDKIIRLYKEGLTTAEIAKEMEMPAGNVPNILEKHWPDYRSYIQPERDRLAEANAPKKSSILPFGRKSKNDKPVVTAEPFTPSLNLTMDDDGFVDHSVVGMANMLNKGRSVKETAEFFGKDINDIKAVESVMAEHFKRVNSQKGPSVKNAEPAPAPEPETPEVVDDEPKIDPKAASIANSIAKRNSTSTFETGAADASPVKFPERVKEPEPMPVENNVPKPSETAVAEKAAEETPTMDELQVPDLSYDELDPEMPSIEPIALDDAFHAEPVPESTMPSIEEELAQREAEKKRLEAEKAQITKFSENMEEETMSPQEKMRMFAQEQIEQNNKKIDELQIGIADKENKSIELGKQADEIYSQIIALQEKAKGFSTEKEKLDIEISQVKGDIEGLKRENEEFKSYIK